jgi:hypothetical protein
MQIDIQKLGEIITIQITTRAMTIFAGITIALKMIQRLLPTCLTKGKHIIDTSRNKITKSCLQFRNKIKIKIMREKISKSCTLYSFNQSLFRRPIADFFMPQWKMIWSQSPLPGFTSFTSTSESYDNHIYRRFSRLCCDGLDCSYLHVKCSANMNANNCLAP